MRLTDGKRTAKKLKKCKTVEVTFTVARNVTASNGNRNFYVQIKNPGGNVLNGGGTFPYSGKTLTYTMKKMVEYTGEETFVTMFWNVTQMMEAGEYRVSIFCDGQMIGSRTFSFE